METVIAAAPVAESVAERYDWQAHCIKLSEIFRLTEAEQEWLRESRVARLIAAIPYVARCPRPERIAFGNLCLYVAEVQGVHTVADHTPEDDCSLYERLRPLVTMEGGDAAVIAHGMHLLALVMLNGYRHSREQDAADGVYNPLNSGAWDYEQMAAGLREKIAAEPCGELDEIVPWKYRITAGWQR